MEAAKQPVGPEVCHLGNFFEAQALRKMMNKVKRSIAKMLIFRWVYFITTAYYLQSKEVNELN